MPSLIKRVLALPSAWLAALFVLFIFGAAGASVAGYRTYDYVQHDNDFCMSCHLMAEPYELFGRSAHRDLGCKSCHSPTLVERSTMGLTQVLENPDSISVHAEVPDEKCVSCHVDGDPGKWTLIANSAGHRVHLESTDTTLADVSCVGCHQSSLHQFAATDETCAQSGCHTDSSITLGAMGDFTIHCTSCHSFAAPPEDLTFEAAQTALAPDADACLSCHVMRTLVEIPEDEPHGAVCSSCHNPHTQETPQQAVETCATAGCHEQPDSLTPFHRGLGDHPLDDCSSCHTAHDFGANQGDDCLSCHTDIFDDAPSSGIIAALHAQPERRAPTVHAVPNGAYPIRVAALLHTPRPTRPVRIAALDVPGSTGGLQLPTDDRPFLHGTHRTIDCGDCHDSSQLHGAVSVAAPVDCASCHHTTEIVDDCATCHEPVERADRQTPRAAWGMTFSTGMQDIRDIDFDHALSAHADADCASCHTEGLYQPVSQTSCDGCHIEHHEDPEATCVSCHNPPAGSAHDVESHLGCSGSGCHTDLPFELAPREGREGCLSCHTALRDHRPDEGACVECHQLPAPRRGEG